MQLPTNILQTLATFEISDSHLLTAQLAEIRVYRIRSLKLHFQVLGTWLCFY